MFELFKNFDKIKKKDKKIVDTIYNLLYYMFRKEEK